MAKQAQAAGLSRLTVAAMLIAAAQTPLGSTMIAVALADISAALRVNVALATTLLVTTYMLLTIVGQNPGGRLTDVLGRWRTLEIGMALCFAGALMGALAPSFWLLVVARCLIALSGALIAPSVLALLRAHVPEARRGRMFGIYSATVGLAAAIGPLIGGELVHAFGWRGIFVANLPLVLLAAILGRSTPPPSDGAEASAAPRPKTSAIGWLIEPSLFKSRVFAAGCLVIFLQSLAMYGLLFQLPQFFELVRGATPRDAGYLLFVMMAGLFVASVAGGALSDRFGARTTALGGLVLMIAGILWLTRLAAFLRPADAFGPVLLLGLALGVTWAPAQSSAMSAVDEARSGIAAGTTSACRYLGGAIGVLILAAYFNAAKAAPVAVHVHIVWMFGAAIALSAIGCFGLPGRLERRKPKG